jgi:hypothetical protein
LIDETARDGNDPERRAAALADIVRLARAHEITSEEIAAAMAEAPAGPTSARDTDGAAEAEGKTALLTRLLAYLGALFVFAGIVIFVAMQWDAMGSLARVIATLGSGVALFAMAFAAASTARFEKAATPLFLIAAVLQPVGILVAIDEYSSGGDWRHAVLAATGVLLAQQLWSFLATGRTSLLFTSLAFGAGFAATAMDLIGLPGGLTALVVGASLTSLSMGIDKTPHADITPFWYLVGSGTLLAGLFEQVADRAMEPVFLGAACGIVYLSTYVKSRSLLAIGTVAILGYIGYFTERHFVDVAGWPLALIALGIVMIGLSAAALRINQRYIAPSR